MTRTNFGACLDLVHEVRLDITKRYGRKPPKTIEIETFTVVELISTIEDLYRTIENYFNGRQRLANVLRSED